MTENVNGNLPKFFKKLNPWIKLTVGLLTIAGLIGGGIWQLNSTYASKGYVKTVEVSAEKGRILLAEESVKTLQQFQDTMRQEQIQRQIKTNVRYWTQLINDTYCKINDLDNQLRSQPNNNYLRNRLIEEKKKLEQYKQKLNELLK